MKRFLTDALLIWLLVTLVSYLHDADEKPQLDEKISEFEEDVARHRPIEQKVESSRLNPIEENAASRMAAAGSDFVVDVMDKGMSLLSQFVYGLMQ
ncbi:MAG: hypothetical protein HFE68_00495 [Erysipelotrichaceae bacterium]|nr:hypothetical protein [Erysipelotrichaceae bacterium]MCI9311824.1 hypothetical protein [Erysipelotrichaceae bacterium]